MGLMMRETGIGVVWGRVALYLFCRFLSDWAIRLRGAHCGNAVQRHRETSGPERKIINK